MKVAIIILIFLSTFPAGAQDSLQNGRWHYLNRFELSAYCFPLSNNGEVTLWGGSELHINALSYKTKRHELGISTGAFYIGRKPLNKGNPTLHYFYMPVNLKYRVYFNRNSMFGEVSIGTPLLIYEDSRRMNGNEFWLNYENAKTTPFYIKEKIYGFHALKFGYQANKHVTLSIGEMSYLYATNIDKLRNLMRISFGVEFKL